MSLNDYEESLAISEEGWSFHAIIMAAMRQADTNNTEKLKLAFPKTWEELTARYYMPGGLLPEEELSGWGL